MINQELFFALEMIKSKLMLNWLYYYSLFNKKELGYKVIMINPIGNFLIQHNFGVFTFITSHCISGSIKPIKNYVNSFFNLNSFTRSSI